jgi:hypothetical protein
VGAVAELGRAEGIPVLAVVGESVTGIELPEGLEVVSLVARFGAERAREDTIACIQEAVAERLAGK